MLIFSPLVISLLYLLAVYLQNRDAPYLGPLQPHLSNAVYSNPGAISFLLNDPDLQLVGIGTRIFLGGAIGYVTWEGTQHFPLQKRLPNRIPIGPAATLALIGDAKQMNSQWVRGCYLKNYGPSIMLGVGIPLTITEPVAHIPMERAFLPQDLWGSQVRID